MVKEEYLARLWQGAAVWNDWRAQNPERRVDLRGADLRGADLRGVNLPEADLFMADLSEADLSGADLSLADLIGTKFKKAKLVGADLRAATLVETDLRYADLTGCRVYGISAWDIELKGATQRDLVITMPDQPQITVDNLKVAQFIYLLLYNQEIRDVIDTITSKVVLILGSFTPPERKAVLDALREELRKSERNYVPIVFDFQKPASKDLTGTVSTLARMARFIIADLTDPRCIPHELAFVVPTNTKVPVQPVILLGETAYTMFDDLRAYPWVLQPYHYETPEQLIADLGERVIGPAEAKVRELRGLTSG